MYGLPGTDELGSSLVSVSRQSPDPSCGPAVLGVGGLLTAVVETSGDIPVHLVAKSEPDLHALAGDVLHDHGDVVCNLGTDLGEIKADGHYACHHYRVRGGGILEDGKELDSVVGIRGVDRREDVVTWWQSMHRRPEGRLCLARAGTTYVVAFLPVHLLMARIPSSRLHPQAIPFLPVIPAGERLVWVPLQAS